MSNTDFDMENIIPLTEANLRDEQKQAMAKAMEEYKQLCLKSFSVNRSGEVIQKEALPILVNYKRWLKRWLTTPLIVL